MSVSLCSLRPVFHSDIEGLRLISRYLCKEQGGRCWCTIPFLKGGVLSFELI